MYLKVGLQERRKASNYFAIPTHGHATPNPTPRCLRHPGHSVTQAHAPLPAMRFVGKRPEDTVVVVTGATGRLGQRVCTELLSRGYQVRATDIKEDRRPPSAREEEVWGLPNTDYPVTVADM